MARNDEAIRQAWQKRPIPVWRHTLPTLDRCTPPGFKDDPGSLQTGIGKSFRELKR